MIVARTQEESDYFVEQEISHCLRLNKKPDLLVEDGETWLVDNIRGCLCRLPVFKPVTTMKTKKYGVLCVFESVKDLIDSRYNKGILAVYCNKEAIIKKRRVVCLSSYTDSYDFESREFANNGGVYLNCVDDIVAHEAYLVVMERNRYANNNVQIIDSFKLKRKDNLFT